MDAIRLEQHLAAESYASRRCLGIGDSAKRPRLSFGVTSAGGLVCRGVW